MAWLDGYTVPANTLGTNGDYYYDKASQDVYLKTAGAWAVVVNTGYNSLASYSLTSLDNARAWIRRAHASGTPSTDDTLLLTLAINSVSRAIQRFTQRQFFAETATAHTFFYDGGGYVDLAPYELRAVPTSVTLGGSALTISDGDGTGDYFPMPRQQTLDGTYLWLTLRDYVRPYPTNSLFAKVLNERDVVVTADWGMTSVPADVELACLIGVEDMYRNPGGAQQRGQGEFAIMEVQDASSGNPLPQASIDLLEPFVRVATGSV